MPANDALGVIDSMTAADISECTRRSQNGDGRVARKCTDKIALHKHRR